ncbi:lytic murein transglycosylase [Shewanella sedimentimangrovi]|nr:lytic murein transglycosylase [Shewanella sedimentimangrovi]
MIDNKMLPLFLAPFLVVAPAHSETYPEFLAGLKQEAKSIVGMNDEALNSAFSQIKLFKKASAGGAPQAQPEKLDDYFPFKVPESLVEQAREQFKLHHETLLQIEKQFGVQPRFVVALWGLRSEFGNRSAGYPALTVNASLAYDGDDKAFHREQVLAGLKVLARDGLAFDAFTANPEGHLGQTAFSAADYLAYAADGDGDGKKDIWQNTTDVFASIATLLVKNGWQAEATWGRQVRVPDGLNAELVGLSHSESFAQWQKLGVRRYDGTDLPDRADMQVSLIMPEGPKGRQYLVYDNYRVLSKLFASDFETLAVTYLSERIKYPPIE